MSSEISLAVNAVLPSLISCTHKTPEYNKHDMISGQKSVHYICTLPYPLFYYKSKYHGRGKKKIKTKKILLHFLHFKKFSRVEFHVLDFQ